jgi:hypothetical protein
LSKFSSARLEGALLLLPQAIATASSIANVARDDNDEV